MTSQQEILATVRSKLVQVNQLVGQFTQVEYELREAFEQLQSLHDQEVQDLQETCKKNGVAIPAKPRSSMQISLSQRNGGLSNIQSSHGRQASYGRSQTSRQSNNPVSPNSSPSRQNYTFDGTVNRSQTQRPAQRGSFIPPPPQHNPPDNSHGRHQSNGALKKAGSMQASDISNNNGSINSTSKSFGHGSDDSKQPPPPSNGFGIQPQWQKPKKKKIVLPNNGLSENDFYKKYWIESGKIGEGSFARVRRITRKEDKKVFALKMVKKKGKSSTDIAALQKEIYVLQNCEHNNIVRLLDWCDTKRRIYMIVEFCDGGDVFERVLQFKKFNESTAAHVIAQVANGLSHAHKKGFVHRDLKPDNLMYLTKDEQSDIKIIDFGLAGICTDGPCTTPCGTAHYAAPEVLGNLAYDTSADLWSLGVIIYTLLCGFPPFFDASNNMKNLYAMIKKGKWGFPSPFWDDISAEAKDLITKLLQKDPKARLTAEQVLKHKWVANTSAVQGKDFRSDYLQQMQKWQSTRHATEMALQESNTTSADDVN